MPKTTAKKAKTDQWNVRIDPKIKKYFDFQLNSQCLDKARFTAIAVFNCLHVTEAELSALAEAYDKFLESVSSNNP